MDFDFSDDQEQLRDAVRKWVDKGYDFERRRAIVKAGGFDRAAYGELAELGLTGLYVAEAQGDCEPRARRGYGLPRLRRPRPRRQR